MQLPAGHHAGRGPPSVSIRTRMAGPTEFFASTPKGMESLLAGELRALGIDPVKETRAGASWTGTLESAYRACLWSRTASRVFMPLARFPADSPESLYAGVHALDWREHLGEAATLAVDAHVSDSAITHSHFAALKIKDAVVDRLRTLRGHRPSIDTERPDVRLNLYLRRNEAVLSLDLAGESLHRRGYREGQAEAPLKENLACAILMRAGWPAIAAEGGSLVDLMCGSGTFLVEGAWMAADVAPGLMRPHFGFIGWGGHDAALWERLLVEARERRAAGLERTPSMAGYDRDPQMIRLARHHLRRAGVQENARLEVRDVNVSVPESQLSAGLVVVNPPYGERLGAAAELPALYHALGQALRRDYRGWRSAVFTSNADLGHYLGLRAGKTYKLYNGALECRLLCFEIGESTERADDRGMEDFANRLKKNYRHLSRWAEREQVGAWRVYDADLHDYNFAIDLYETEPPTVHVQEYAPPAHVDAGRAQARVRAAISAITRVLEVTPAQVVIKQRRQQKEGGQYEAQGRGGRLHEIREGEARFLVNFTDYLDTGLFLDTRPVRQLIGRLASERDFLNLFGYTGTATVYAALAGARSTTTVDLSRTYLDWAERNLELNGIRGRQHQLLQEDVLTWIEQPPVRRYGLIYLDPPTFSRSKRMRDTLDIQRDHERLIRLTLKHLADDGILIFCCNQQTFKLDRQALSDLTIEDISRSTLPPDFARQPKIHQCFRITHAGGPDRLRGPRS